MWGFPKSGNLRPTRWSLISFPTPPSGRRLLVSAPWRARQLLQMPFSTQVQHLRVFFPSAFWDIKDSTLFMKLLICRSNRSTLEFDVSDSLTARMGVCPFVLLAGLPRIS
ncbi:hypothetical protein TNCV_1500821 [Trichonephila clavipes]|nr:hypothetical protein TNCV_1500821 [Trichonephila clavipes]